MRLKIESAAKRALRALPKGAQDMIMREIGLLEDDPFPPHSIPLRRRERYRRLKVPPYRVLYKVGHSLISITRIEKWSGTTYRGFNPKAKRSKR